MTNKNPKNYEELIACKLDELKTLQAHTYGAESFTPLGYLEARKKGYLGEDSLDYIVGIFCHRVVRELAPQILKKIPLGVLEDTEQLRKFIGVKVYNPLDVQGVVREFGDLHESLQMQRAIACQSILITSRFTV